MGFIDTIKKNLHLETEGKDQAEELSSMGLKVLQDKKMAYRITAIQALFDDLAAEIPDNTKPQDYVIELSKRLDLLNRGIHSLASPYYRSGSNAAFRQLMEGWTLWNALAKTWISSVEDRIKNVSVNNGDSDLSKITAIDIETLVRRLQHVLEMHVFQDGMLVLAESYLTEDVAPTHATIVQTAGQHGGVDLSKLRREDIE